MREASLPDIKARIASVVSTSRIGPHVREIDVEAEDRGDDVLRVMIAFDSFNGIGDQDMLAVMTSIEKAVEDIDERFPSVRFAEAA